MTTNIIKLRQSVRITSNATFKLKEAKTHAQLRLFDDGYYVKKEIKCLKIKLFEKKKCRKLKSLLIFTDVCFQFVYTLTIARHSCDLN